MPSSTVPSGVLIRQATPADADSIAAAHVDSIRTLGARHYPSEVVADWSAARTAERYTVPMARGVVYFVALETAVTGDAYVLGMASHALEEDGHHIAVYVRGLAVRRGLGRALYQAAETHASGAGASEIVINASLGAVDFWTAMGFEDLGPTTFRLRSGRPMPCVRMRKRLIREGMKPC